MLGRFIGPNEDYFGTCAGCNAFGYSEPDNDPFTGSFNDPNLFNRKYWSGTARYVHDFGNITLTSITDFQKLKKDYTEDSDLTPTASIAYTTHQNLHQISQEIRLSGHSSRLDWTAGVYAIEIDTDNTYDTAIDFIDTTLSYDGSMRTRSLAAFAQMEYKLTDQLTVTGGLRYSKDWKRTNFVNRISDEEVFVFNRSTVGSLARRHDGDYSGKIELAYSPTTDVLTYLSVNRGTKSGGFASPSSPPADPSTVPFKPETLTSYEGGAKLTIFGGAAHLNLSAFYYDYHGYQSFALVPPTTLTISNQDAVIKGVEAEFNVRPFSGFYAQIFAAVLDTKVKDLVLPSGRIADGKMPQAPKLSVGGLARYQFRLGTAGQLSLQTDWKHDGVQYFSAFNPQVDRERARITGNARISFQPPSERWEAAVFVNNLTDREYRIGNADASGFSGHAQQTFAPPRWIGGSFTVRLE